MHRPAWRRHVVVLALYVLVAIAFAWPIPAHLSTRLPGRVTGDTGVYVWNLWIFSHELLHEHHHPLTTSYIFSADSPADLSLHNYTIFADLVALPVLRVAGPVAAYNLVWILLPIIAAFAMFLLAMEVLRGRAGPESAGQDGWPTWAAAWLAGVLFAFSPALAARSTEHLSLMGGAPLAVFTVVWLRALRTRRLPWAAASGLAIAWALVSDPYYGIYCLMLGAFFLAAERVELTWERRPPSSTTRLVARALAAMALPVALLYAWIAATGGGDLRLPGTVIGARTLYTPAFILTVIALAGLALSVKPHAAMRGPIDARRDLLLIAAAGVSGAIAASPLLWAVANIVVEGRYVSAPVLWRSSMPGVDALAFLMPNPNHPWFGGPWRQFLSGLPGGFAENAASLTLVAVCAILFAASRDRLRLPGAWLALTLLFASLAVGPFVSLGSFNTCVPTPWALARYVPLIGGARAPARFTAVVMMGVAVLFAIAVREIIARRAGRQYLLGAAIAGALLFELSPAPREVYSAEIPSIYQVIAADPRPVLVLELPYGARDGVSSTGDFSAASQFYQAFHHKRLLGGYLSRVSRDRHARLRSTSFRGSLIRLSEGRPVRPGLAEELRQRPVSGWRRRLGYVVIDQTRATPALVEFAIRAFDLEKIGESDRRELYRPRRGGTRASPASLAEVLDQQRLP